MTKHFPGLDFTVFSSDSLNHKIIVVRHDWDENVQANYVDQEGAQDVKGNHSHLSSIEVFDVLTKHLLVLLTEQDAEPEIKWVWVVTDYCLAKCEVDNEYEWYHHILHSLQNSVFNNNPGGSKCLR